MIENNNATGPLTVSFDLTNRCNLRCLHCYNNSGSKNNASDELSDKEVIDLIEEIATIRPSSFCFCGGEPLLRKDLLFDAISILRKADVICSMVTNGMLLDIETGIKLKEKGLYRVQISLDGNHESHIKLRGDSSSYQKAIDALRILKDVGIDSGVAFSPTRWNIEDIEHVFKTCLDYGVEELRIQNLMPIGRGEKNIDIMPTDSQYYNLRRFIKKINASQIINNKKPKIELGDPINHLVVYSRMNDDTSSYTEAISITANGDIYVSLYLPLIIGNVRKHSLKYYWEKDLSKIWRKKTLREMAYQYTSVKHLNKHIEQSYCNIRDNNIDVELNN